MCSDAALQAWEVKQDLLLAARHRKALLPVSFPEQMAFFLAGRPSLAVAGRPVTQWLPQLLYTLRGIGVHHHGADYAPSDAGPVVAPLALDHSLESLRMLARFTDHIWPVPAEHARRALTRSALRGLGAPQDYVAHQFHLGSRLCLLIESPQAGHLLLLDAGPEGIIYCLCPSHFAPDTVLPRGRSLYPQAGSRYDAFVLTGKPGREEVLALISDVPLDLDWLPSGGRVPARVLSDADISTLLARLELLDGTCWTALSTYFDVTP